MDDSKVNINAIKFEEEFSQKKKDVAQTIPKPEEKKSDAKPTMLVGSRQQNINIVLNKLRIPVYDIAEALTLYDEKILTVPVCELLM